MNRKAIISILVVFIIGVAVALFFMLRIKTKSITDTIRLVPADAEMLIEIRDLNNLNYSLKNENPIWDALTSIPELKHFDTQLSWLDSVYNATPLFQDILESNSLIISIHNIGHNSLGALFLAGLDETHKRDAIYEHIEALADSSGTIEKRLYDKHNIYQLETKRDKRLHFAFVESNFVASFNTLLIEDAIRLSQDDLCIMSDPYFEQVYQTAGRKELANIYINLERLEDLFGAFLKPETLKNCTPLIHYGRWMELDLRLQDKTLSMNGFANFSDSLSDYLGVFKEQKSRPFAAEEILPDKSIFFLNLTIDESSAFQSEYVDFTNAHISSGYLNDAIEKYTDSIHANLYSFVYKILHQQVCVAVADFNKLDIYQDAVLVMKTKSSSKAEKEIRQVLQKYTDETGQEYSNYVEAISLDASITQDVYRFPVTSWPKVVFGDFFSRVQPRYITVFDNYVLMGATKNSLGKIIHHKLLNKTLDKNLAYNDFKENLFSENLFYFYMNTAQALPWFSGLFNDEIAGRITAQSNSLKNIQHVAFQQRLSDDLIYNNIVLKYNHNLNETPHTVWESRLDTAVAFKPKLVINHYTGDKEIFVQDARNTVYLINKNGHVLWRLPIGGEIIGEVHQVDIYKNDKLQYLFNTRNKLYIIDRLGNFVENYPIPLRSPATTGHALFDYENNRDYRIFIPCEDKKVYVYDAEGQLVQGWQFEGTEYPVNTSLQHFRIGTKDYIVLNDKYRIYILNRRGDVRVPTAFDFEASKENPFYLEAGPDVEKPCLLRTDHTGKIYRIYFNGSIDSLRIDRFSPDHYFLFRDLDADGENDYIFLDGNRLEVYAQDKSEICKYEFDAPIQDPPVYYYFSDRERKLGLLSRSQGLIFLINKDASLHEGFPLTGTSLFSISYMTPQSKHFNLFVGGKGNFLYNYRIK